MKIGKDRYGDNDYLLNKEALGKLVETERLLAPEDDEDSMREYLKDR
ncbi:MAG: hypothetical protein M0D53_12710 [Flavobacterium sp. JAD_PAG50586_2]|nr:MAG: hypothetical protein M0D53_12710 [Flavobacterium sp. JAD_PAG50586_2]